MTIKIGYWVGFSAAAIITTPACYNGCFENAPGDQGVFLYFGGTGNNGSSCG